MEIKFCEEVVNSYLNFLKKDFHCYKEDKNLMRVVTPYLDLSSDSFEFFIKKINENEFLVTDYGETLRSLDDHNVSVLSESKRYEIVKNLSSYYGIDLEKNELKTKSKPSEFGEIVFNFINLMTKINSLIFTAKEGPSITFKQEVKTFLEKKTIKNFKENEEYIGASNLSYQMDFSFLNDNIKNLLLISPSSKNESKNISNSCVAKIEDIRKKDSKFICSVLYNDINKDYWDDEIIYYLNYYKTTPISWTNEKEKLEKYAKAS